MHAAPVTFLAAPAILAAAGLVFGLWPSPLDTALDTYADTVPGEGDYELALWHGFNLPLLLSVLVLAVGTAAFFGRSRFPRARLMYLPLGNADRIYDAVIRGADMLSVRLTGITQRGSIPATQSVILATLVIVPAAVLALGARDRPEFALWGSPLQVIVGVLILAAAVGAAMMRNRLAAVLLVGVTGYGCGTIFAFHGAPDLALTQFLVETLTLVIFVLVLRTLPAESDRTNIARHRLPRACWLWPSGQASPRWQRSQWPPAPMYPIAALLPDAAYYRGHGANTVNVLLVDIRAWDTLGEISVLLVAATGVASMVFRHRRFGAAPRVADAGQPDIGPVQAIATSPAAGDTTWLRGSELRDPRNRSLVLEVATRMIFPLIMVLSAYFFFAGHNTPGGGFAGGLTAGLALVLRYLAGGRYELGETLPLDAGKILGAGLGAVGGHRGGVAVARRTGAVVGGDRVRRSGARPHQVRHRAVLRPRRVPDRRRPGARRAAQPRRARGRRDDPATGGGDGAMTTFIVPLVLIGGLTSVGVYLLLERGLTRMLLGLLLIGNAVNLLILTVGGPSGNPPMRGRDQRRPDDDRRPVGAGHDPDRDRHQHGHRRVRVVVDLPDLPADHRRRGRPTIPRTPGWPSSTDEETAALDEARPTPDQARDTDEPDELDALPGLEGSR